MLPEKKAKHQPAKNPLIYNKGDLGGRERKSWPAYIAWKKSIFNFKRCLCIWNYPKRWLILTFTLVAFRMDKIHTSSHACWVFSEEKPPALNVVGIILWAESADGIRRKDIEDEHSSFSDSWSWMKIDQLPYSIMFPHYNRLGHQIRSQNRALLP